VRDADAAAAARRITGEKRGPDGSRCSTRDREPGTDDVTAYGSRYAEAGETKPDHEADADSTRSTRTRSSATADGARGQITMKTKGGGCGRGANGGCASIRQRGCNGVGSTAKRDEIHERRAATAAPSAAPEHRKGATTLGRRRARELPADATGARKSRDAGGGAGSRGRAAAISREETELEQAVDT